MPKKNVTIEKAKKILKEGTLKNLTDQEIEDIINLMYSFSDLITEHIANKENSNNKGQPNE